MTPGTWTEGEGDSERHWEPPHAKARTHSWVRTSELTIFETKHADGMAEHTPNAASAVLSPPPSPR